MHNVIISCCVYSFLARSAVLINSTNVLPLPQCRAFPLLRRHRQLSATPSPPPHRSPKHQPCQQPCGVPQGRAQQFPKGTPGTPCGPSGSCCGASQPWIWGIWGFGVRCVARGRAVPNGPAVFVSLVLGGRCLSAVPQMCSSLHTPRPAPQVRGQPGGDTQGRAAEGRPEPCVGFQLRCDPGCAHSWTHSTLIILGACSSPSTALTPQTPLARNPALLTRRAGGGRKPKAAQPSSCAAGSALR